MIVLLASFAVSVDTAGAAGACGAAGVFNFMVGAAAAEGLAGFSLIVLFGMTDSVFVSLLSAMICDPSLTVVFSIFTFLLRI